MKKAFLSIAFISSLFLSLGVVSVFAQAPAATCVPNDPTCIQVVYPGVGVDPFTTSVGDVISNVLKLVFIAAALFVLFHLVLGAFNWINSGGDKDQIAKARQRIIQTLIGLAVLALAFLIAVVAGRVVNINLLSLPSLPTLNSSPCTINAPKAVPPATNPPGITPC